MNRAMSTILALALALSVSTSATAQDWSTFIESREYQADEYLAALTEAVDSWEAGDTGLRSTDLGLTDEARVMLVGLVSAVQGMPVEELSDRLTGELLRVAEEYSQENGRDSIDATGILAACRFVGWPFCRPS